MAMLENKSYAGNKDKYIEYLSKFYTGFKNYLKTQERKNCTGEENKWYRQKIKEYLESLKKSGNTMCSYYTDPDITHKKGAGSEFYSQLAEYLNAMERKHCNSKWSYTAVKSGEGNKTPSGIEVSEGGTPVMFLRSDQFGFSAPKGTNEGKTWDASKYPYAKYIKSADDSDDSKVANYCEFVADVIWDTRRLGGSFIWPVIKNIKNSRWESIYNKNRGVNSYIEDRVDITLWEIKKFYEKWNKFTPEDPKNKLEKFICEINKEKEKEAKLKLLSGKDWEQLARWLTHFENFDNYIEFFSFESFINLETKNVRNIATGEDLSEDIAETKGKPIKDMKLNELGEMLKILRCQTNLRTAIMIQKVLDKNSKIWCNQISKTEEIQCRKANRECMVASCTNRDK